MRDSPVSDSLSVSFLPCRGFPPPETAAPQPMTPPAPTAGDPAFPLALMLDGKRVVLVGGGSVAARRAAAFRAAGAVLRIIAPRLDPRLQLLLGPEDEWLPRTYQPGDLAEAWLVHTATGRTEVDAAVAAEAEQRRLFCVNAGAAGSGSAAVPARATVHTDTGTVQVAVTSGDPRRSVAVARHVQSELQSGRAPLHAQRTAAGAGHTTADAGRTAAAR